MPKRKTYSRAWRRKVGEGVSRHYQKVLEEGHQLPKKKRCPRCKKVKDASFFGVCARKLKSGLVSETLESWCKPCKARAQKVRLQRQEAEGIDTRAKKREQDRRWRANLSPKKLAALREREREWQTITRRKNGHGSYGARMPSRTDGRVPVEPIAGFLEGELDARRRSGEFGETAIAEATGVAQRRIYGILKREEARVSLRVVDKLLTGLGCPHELHLLYPLD